jgi:hypothetical protein
MKLLGILSIFDSYSLIFILEKTARLSRGYLSNSTSWHAAMNGLMLPHTCLNDAKSRPAKGIQ